MIALDLYLAFVVSRGVTPALARSQQRKRGPAGPRFLDSDRTDQTGMFCCATMQYSMPIENMVLKRLA